MGNSDLGTAYTYAASKVECQFESDKTVMHDSKSWEGEGG